jgi:hypothetical protein
LQVSQIIVSNHGSFDASIWVIVGPGAALALNPTVEAGDINITLDLTTVRGLNNGDQVSLSMSHYYPTNRVVNSSMFALYLDKVSRQTITPSSPTLGTPVMLATTVSLALRLHLAFLSRAFTLSSYIILVDGLLSTCLSSILNFGCIPCK